MDAKPLLYIADWNQNCRIALLSLKEQKCIKYEKMSLK